MNTKERRKEIVNILKDRDKPIKGNNIAELFGVSRQVIVQDIAVLRAEGQEILATPQGYMIIDKKRDDKLLETIVSKHKGYKAIEDELNTIVDLGGEVLDVVVEHPIYGEIKCSLMIKSRLDVHHFMKNIKQKKAEPLAVLTNGVHIHTLKVPNNDVFLKIKKELRNKKYLIED